MTDRFLRALRALLVLALLGLGPATRIADVVVFHSGAAAPTMSHQIDDGSVVVPHGDGCLLAVASAPATPAMSCGRMLATTPIVDVPEPPPLAPPGTVRATGPPSTRAPPA